MHIFSVMAITDDEKRLVQCDKSMKSVAALIVCVFS